ncbi:MULTISPECIES: DUF808 domain-containing protein [unclassified Pseudomonas]|uniref:DUF808 domain-containing protein n=1 Tax=unclassified Pseudomonas TaxID=196821 RepID=UPI002448A27C|nr:MULTISPECIES: DUF808 domain-containing protein [unclassified Pseudomonas]MDH0896572.1 DUF808 domain-containing protein [Pseudomonas sp. GD03875]MDH1066315.1 DUF808 domain-containing protein [Pseudomonas sp. GD03985]
MAGASLLTLLDDIASVLDDVSVMTKVAAKKTAGVLGDDLALNAQQVTGVKAERELPVVWAVAKGSFINKAILVPAALLISAFAPWLVTPLLMLGGAFLCYEGFEKLAHKFLHSKEEDQQRHAEHVQALADPAVDVQAFEKEKIKGAVRTDFILSAEIIAITLGVVAEQAFLQQVIVLSGIALLMTVGVYGLVAGIVKLDDAGLYLSQRASAAAQGLGRGILWLAPWLMKLLSVVGTAAMFMVGGGILTHGIPGAHELIHHWSEAIGGVPAIGGVLAVLAPTVINALFGVLAGGVVLAVVSVVGKAWKALRS